MGEEGVVSRGMSSFSVSTYQTSKIWSTVSRILHVQSFATASNASVSVILAFPIYSMAPGPGSFTKSLSEVVLAFCI